MSVLRFMIASMLPAVLIALGAIWGAPFSAAAVALITVVVLGLDRVVLRAPKPEEADGHALIFALAVLHVLLLYLCIWAVGRASFSVTDKLLLLIAAGLYLGQVGNSNAHELIHRSNRISRRLGMVFYASLLNGHHVSAHRLVHHVHVATPKDPNSARLGMGFWKFYLRGSAGAFRKGYAAESKLRAGRSAVKHPYVIYGCLSAASVGAAAALSGWLGVLGLGLIAGHAHLQLYLSDYVQHYGLTRRQRPDGTYEPIGPAHSWNAPQWCSGAMMLNAPRHSDHHAHPGRAFPQLGITSDTMPILPHALPVMAVIALFPPLWRSVMNDRAASWGAAHAFSQSSLHAA